MSFFDKVSKAASAVGGAVAEQNRKRAEMISRLESKSDEQLKKIIKDDIETQVIPRICDVLSFYSIGSNLCPDDPTVKVTTETTSTWGIWVILKWVGIVVWILGGVFLLIVIFFAVKARLQQNADEEVQNENQQ